MTSRTPVLARIQDRIVPYYILLVVKCDLRMTLSVTLDTIKTPPWSKTIGAKHRPMFYVMLISTILT